MRGDLKWRRDERIIHCKVWCFTDTGLLILTHSVFKISPTLIAEICLLSVAVDISFNLGSISGDCVGGGTYGPCQKYKVLTLHVVTFQQTSFS